jgi:hypothetical protein
MEEKGMYGMNVHKAVVMKEKRNRYNNSLRK